MHSELQAQLAFHLTGNKPGAGLEVVAGLGLHPALFAGYRDLTRLRYDFPLVLVQNATDRGSVQCLCAIVDGVVHEVAQGDDGERLTRHLLRLEQEIRVLMAEGASGALSALWEKAAGRLAARGDDSLKDSLNRASAALKIDGKVVDCGSSMPADLINHAWASVQEKKARKFREDLARLTQKLSDILQVDRVRSKAGQSAESLKASVGASHGEDFDFQTMSRLLTRSSPKTTLPESRRRRIESLLSVLRSQRFFAAQDGVDKRGAGEKTHSFVFENCAAALAAYRERMPKAIELAKAVAIAGLEIESEYNEAKHDPFFREFDAAGLDERDLAMFPDYLVLTSAEKLQGVENDKLMEIFSAGLPVKILVQTDDLLEASPAGDAHLAIGVRSKQLASMALGLNEVYVLQSSGSNLFQFRDRILKGLTYAGPALFSVFSGSTGKTADLPPYLTAAAAMESRVFPAFAYDPSAGADWASRFYLEGNPQVDRDWPVQSFAYEDAEHQKISQDLVFTLVDFVACDQRYARHFARVPQAKWNGSMVPVGEYLAGDTQNLSGKIPCLLMVDGNDVLHKVIVDDKLIQEARRCREMWHSLQELGGIHNSHAERLLARERKVWEERQQSEVAVAPKPAAAAPAAPVATPAAAAMPAPAEPEEEKSSDEPYIETPRCTSCDECTQINNVMFAYDANKQASIVNLDAGTYRQLVEAAESCQVSIIHPGKPRNPNEPGLEELVKRAESFL
ncbi:MAG: hypothetical protein HY525_17530 [Betaproteobacteria bacterium]|nr:hypothetical protein [Betaproteobacteria bacterium]